MPIWANTTKPSRKPKRRSELEPTITGYANLAGLYINVNRLKDARQTLQEAQQKDFDDLFIRSNLYSLAFLSGDTAEMEREVAWAAGRPNEEDQMLNTHADTQAYYGRLEKARDLARRASDSAVRSDAKETGAQWLVYQGLREAEVGNVTAARQGVARALALAPGRDVKVLSALALARTGETAQSRTILEALAKVRTHQHLSQGVLVSGDRGIDCDGATGSPTGRSSRSNPPFPTNLGSLLPERTMYPAYIRGLAYLAQKNGPAAAAEFQKFLDHPGIVQNFLLGSLAHLQLARAYALSGDTAKAKTAYQDFFTLWKDADPDIPILKEAKAEYAKLQ